jgi:hypothetical protein
MLGVTLTHSGAHMISPDHLYILWTNADPITFEKMVSMYACNSLKHQWWKQVTVIVWGSTTKVTAENEQVQAQIKAMLEAGVLITACRACADQLGVTGILEDLGIDVMYWGEPLTELLKEKATLLTI